MWLRDTSPLRSNSECFISLYYQRRESCLKYLSASSMHSLPEMLIHFDCIAIIFMEIDGNISNNRCKPAKKKNSNEVTASDDSFKNVKCIFMDV